MRVNEDREAGKWQGIGGHCRLAIPRNALDHIDDVTYLSANEDFDELGRLRLIEPATTADWYRHSEPYCRYIPTSAEPGYEAEWFQAMDLATPGEQTASGGWRIPAAHCGVMENTLIAFRDAVETIAEHPKYDINIIATHAKRSVLDMWGHLAWWISSVPDWDVGVPQEVVDRILGWNLLSRPKRGFLISLTRDWTEVNFGLLVRLGIPLYYIWGTFEEADPRYLRLSPRLMHGYRNACQRADLRSMWGDEISHLWADFEECARFDAFLQLKLDPRARENLSAPAWTEHTGRIIYEVKDLESWKRRPVEDDENWCTLDKLYHHSIVENHKEQTTTVIFLQFHRKPMRAILTEADDFMDEEVVEDNPSEFRERFKGRCAPRQGQIFDVETGVERAKAVNFNNPVAVSIPRYLYCPFCAKLGIRSFEPDRVTRAYPVRQRTPPPFVAPWHPVHRIREKLTRRAEFLESMREWAAQITSTVVLWQIPAEYGWNMEFIKQGYLIISEASEVRLRLLALMTLGVRFARHVLTLGIEHGIGFRIGLENMVYPRFAPLVPLEHRATTKALIESDDRRLEPGASAVVTHERFLRLLGEVAGLPNARAIIGRGGGPSWIVRAHGYLGLVKDFMSGPSAQVTLYHGGANDSANEPSLGLRWDELRENDYQCIYGFVPGTTREKDTWIYPPDKMLEEISKHYYREWNSVVDDHFRCIKKEWDDRPCHGKLCTRKEWITFFHTSNHGRFAPAIEVNNAWIEEGARGSPPTDISYLKAAALPGPLNGRKLGGPIVKLAGRYLEGSTQLQIFATRHPTRPTGTMIPDISGGGDLRGTHIPGTGGVGDRENDTRYRWWGDLRGTQIPGTGGVGDSNVLRGHQYLVSVVGGHRHLEGSLIPGRRGTFYKVATESNLDFVGQQGHHLQNAIDNSCSTWVEIAKINKLYSGHNTFGIYHGVYLLDVIYHILVMKNGTIWLYKKIALYPYYALLYNVKNPKTYPWALDTVYVLESFKPKGWPIHDGTKETT
ncbi:hypothetical protein C8F04DRAFT_1190987 [Mycena alexandri]|uniref:Uncharacterized protein n=1 Tax=Mycena alexandri TaxID=1745969 RepID=A0AAD6SEB6_9AGAR|nr:hypothetical protein C8F04DRAFT_1190987 [Mycena alexandri]